MTSYLWKVTAKHEINKIPAGANVEIIKTGTNGAPRAEEIIDAFMKKYGLRIPCGSASGSHFDIKRV